MISNTIDKDSNKKIYIAGAHSRSRTARVYLEYLNANLKVLAFLVSPEMEDNPNIVDDIPVLPINDDSLDRLCTVYLGTRGVNHEKLTRELRESGFEDIRPITVKLDSELRNNYLEKWYEEQGRDFIRLDMLAEDDRTCCYLNDSKKPIESDRVEDSHSVAIYVATSIYDGKLKALYNPVTEEKMIHVGAALTEARISECSCTDDEGDNISARNRQFCELTGLYWIWKNATEDYVGLVHYRRHFILPDNWKEIVRANDIDVILPVPLYVPPSVKENYRERHDAYDWDFMESYFDERLPDEKDKLLEIMNGNLYSPCNMIVAKREVLTALCEWLFPILFAVAEHGGEKEDCYQSRYPGFLSERLITYFFESRRDKYNVIYCNKNFLE